MKTNKYLIVINSLDIGGAENLVVNSSILLNRLGYTFDVLVLVKSNTNLADKLLENNVTIKYVGLASIRNPLNILRIRSIIQEYQIVHVHLFPSLYWVAFSTIFLKSAPPLIATEHSTSNKRRSIGLLKYIDRLVYRMYHRIIGISKAATINLASHLNSGDRISTIENGINLSEFHNARGIEISNFGFAATDIILSVVANFRAAKDQDTVIRSLSILPQNVKLLLVGDGIRRAECERLTEKLGVSNRVCFLGVRSDVPEILKSSYICIVSSHWEGFGLAAVEGMASGKPVLATNVCGLREVVDDDDLLFNVGDYKALASKVTQLIRDKQLYDSKVKNSLVKADRFSLDKMINSYIKLYKEILE